MKIAIAAWILAGTFASGALAQEHLTKEAIEKYGLTFRGEVSIDVDAIPGLMEATTMHEWKFSLPDIGGLPRVVTVPEHPTIDQFLPAYEECTLESVTIYEYLKKKTGKTEF